ncbi:MAG: MFS transporter [Oscillospiraceae bacterium]|nr:MFS transporter [Oscillospiraceae bacterium]
MNLKTFTKKERNAFMTGLAGQNIIFTIMGTFATYFLRDTLLFPAALLAVMLPVVMVFDAVTDPFMGVLIDRTKSRLGKCRPWLVAMPGVIFVFVMLSYMGQPYNATARNVGTLIFTFAAYLLWGVFYMAGDIPLWGITSLMTEDEKQRQSLQSYARMVAGIGAAVAMFGFPAIAVGLGQALGNERTGFIIAALIFAAVGCGTYQLVGLFVKEKISPPPQKTNVRENFRMAWNNKPFRRMILSGIFAAPRNLIMIVSMPLITYYFADRNPLLMLLYTAILGGGVFGGMFIAMILVPKLLQRWRKKTIYNASLLVGIPVNLLLFGLYMLSVTLGSSLTRVWFIIPLVPIFVLIGATNGLFTVLQTNMITDSVDLEEYTSNRRPDGFFFSGQTFLVKVGNGICLMIYNAFSAIVLFSGDNIRVLQHMAESEYAEIPRNMMQRGSEAIAHYMPNVGSLTENNLFWFFFVLFFCASVVPAVGCALGVIPTLKYELTEEKHEEILAELQRRRREGETA